MFHRLSLVKKVFLSLSAALILSAVTFAQQDTLKGLRGPAFSDPSKIQEMPEEWGKQPIKYEASAGDADIAIALDQQMYPALSPFIREYAKSHNLKIAINEGTCGITTGMLSRKTADIGGVCCPPDVTDRFRGLQYHTIGIMSLVIIVHPDNPIDNITFEQAQKIFQGEITRWSELKTADGKKGPDTPIQVITRLHCKIRPGHWRLLLDNEELFTPGITDVGAIPDMIFQVAANQRAIGNELVSMVYQYEKNKGKVKILKINGYNPLELSNLLSLKYPLYHVYSLTTWEEKWVANPKAKKLVDYLMQEVELQGSKLYLVPVSQLKKAGWKFKGNELIGEPR
ncbi:MAG: substrate-binding domain-containing protein [Thermodesulfovibrionia bacterium]|nr:substrate-binding domain-containing protein [Thermodesulfovibrionia bacterium]